MTVQLQIVHLIPAQQCSPFGFDFKESLHNAGNPHQRVVHHVVIHSSTCLADGMVSGTSLAKTYGAASAGFSPSTMWSGTTASGKLLQERCGKHSAAWRHQLIRSQRSV